MQRSFTGSWQNMCHCFLLLVAFVKLETVWRIIVVSDPQVHIWNWALQRSRGASGNPRQVCIHNRTDTLWSIICSLEESVLCSTSWPDECIWSRVWKDTHTLTYTPTVLGQLLLFTRQLVTQWIKRQRKMATKHNHCCNCSTQKKQYAFIFHLSPSLPSFLSGKHNCGCKAWRSEKWVVRRAGGGNE